MHTSTLAPSTTVSTLDATKNRLEYILSWSCRIDENEPAFGNQERQDLEHAFNTLQSLKNQVEGTPEFTDQIKQKAKDRLSEYRDLLTRVIGRRTEDEVERRLLRNLISNADLNHVTEQEQLDITLGVALSMGALGGTMYSHMFDVAVSATPQFQAMLDLIRGVTVRNLPVIYERSRTQPVDGPERVLCDSLFSGAPASVSPVIGALSPEEAGSEESGNGSSDGGESGQ